MHGAKTCIPALGLVVIASLATPGSAVSEESSEHATPLDEARQAMDALPALAGRWVGEGWIRRGEGPPQQFLSEEIVTAKLEGQILLVEGIHRSREDPSQEVFRAFAVLSYDPEDDVYRFHSHTDQGRGGDFEGRLEEGAFVWGIEVPGGRIRYRIRIQEDHWKEVGEFSPDGESWNQFFQMELERVETAGR